MTYSRVAILLLMAATLMVTEMFVLWLWHLPRRNAALVDVGWGAGLGMLAVLYACLGPAPMFRSFLLAGVVVFWSFRLSWHLYRDRIAGDRPEEGRYETLRARWGSKAPFYFLLFFLLQGVLNVFLSLPFLFISFNVSPHLKSTEWFGVALWLLALCGEAFADRQLKVFKADPSNKGLVCDRGLWRYSRHPNYFCEWLIWCSYALMATSSAKLGFFAWICPVIILFLLLKVTGIPPTEAQALRSRGDAYRRYQARTRAFFPWFPKNESVSRGST